MAICKFGKSVTYGWKNHPNKLAIVNWTLIYMVPKMQHNHIFMFNWFYPNLLVLSFSDTLFILRAERPSCRLPLSEDAKPSSLFYCTNSFNSSWETKNLGWGVLRIWCHTGGSLQRVHPEIGCWFFPLMAVPFFEILSTVPFLYRVTPLNIPFYWIFLLLVFPFNVCSPLSTLIVLPLNVFHHHWIISLLVYALLISPFLVFPFTGFHFTLFLLLSHYWFSLLLVLPFTC